MQPSTNLLKAIAVTAELTGTMQSEGAAQVMATDLAQYPESQVMGALTRCRRELRGRLTIADVIQRLDDGRPGMEEAWAMLPKSEDQTVVWTDEMAEAYGVCCSLLDHDEIAARMAFKESYSRALNAARNSGKSVRWYPSIGHNVYGREGPLLEAVTKGLLLSETVQVFLPKPADVKILENLRVAKKIGVENE